MGGLLVATLARAVLLHRVCLRGPRRRFRAQRARIRPRHVLVRPFGARDARIGGGIRVSDVACAVFARVARGPRRGVRLARRAEELSRHVLEGPRRTREAATAKDNLVGRSVHARDDGELRLVSAVAEAGVGREAGGGREGPEALRTPCTRARPRDRFVGALGASSTVAAVSTRVPWEAQAVRRRGASPGTVGVGVRAGRTRHRPPLRLVGARGARGARPSVRARVPRYAHARLQRRARPGGVGVRVRAGHALSLAGVVLVEGRGARGAILVCRACIPEVAYARRDVSAGLRGVAESRQARCALCRASLVLVGPDHARAAVAVTPAVAHVAGAAVGCLGAGLVGHGVGGAELAEVRPDIVLVLAWLARLTWADPQPLVPWTARAAEEPRRAGGCGGGVRKRTRRAHAGAGVVLEGARGTRCARLAIAPHEAARARAVVDADRAWDGRGARNHALAGGAGGRAGVDLEGADLTRHAAARRVQAGPGEARARRRRIRAEGRVGARGKARAALRRGRVGAVGADRTQNAGASP
mmetsp:Transcript_7294/g.17125  ORF Transcript_7294/g.17125 Transcript_7294/m.17125 type:complete len:530 (+) Transcript_7294:5852-7441(+)